MDKLRKLLFSGNAYRSWLDLNCVCFVFFSTIYLNKRFLFSYWWYSSSSSKIMQNDIPHIYLALNWFLLKSLKAICLREYQQAVYYLLKEPLVNQILQGFIIGPLFYSLYICQIYLFIKYFLSHFYADDIIDKLAHSSQRVSVGGLFSTKKYQSIGFHKVPFMVPFFTLHIYMSNLYFYYIFSNLYAYDT